MKRYQGPKLAAQIHFVYRENSVKNEQKMYKHKNIANILETAGF